MFQIPPRPWIEYGRGGPSFTKPKRIFREKSEYSDVCVNQELKSRLSTMYSFFNVLISVLEPKLDRSGMH